MARIVSVGTALPAFRCPQAQVRDAFARLCRGDRARERLLPVFDRTGVATRYFVRPPDWYAEGPSFETRNAVFAEAGLELALEAVERCLARAGVGPESIDHLFCVTTTGLLTPSLDARLAGALAMERVQRLPLFGLGCAGGAGALARAAHLLRGSSDERALVVSLELCSLVFSPDARSPTDVVGSALFGDGAAAVLLASGGAGAGPAIEATRTHLFRERPDLMGWDFTSDGMRLVLSRDVPDFVGSRVRDVVTGFLRDQELALADLDHFILHPGGAKVMAMYHSAFGVPEEALELARTTMRDYGNQSSASVLFMLHDLVQSGRPGDGDRGLMTALGPGFAAEMLSLRW